MKTRIFLMSMFTAVFSLPVWADEHSDPQVLDAPGRYSNFIMKIPYSFDLPPEIVGVVLTCSVYADGQRNGVGWEVLIRLANGNSGEVLTGFGELVEGDIEEFNRINPTAEKYIRDAMTPEEFAIRSDCTIKLYATNRVSFVHAYKDNVGRYGLFLERITANQRTPKAWLSDDFNPIGIRRTFHHYENEAFGELPGGALRDGLQPATTTISPAPNVSDGLQSLENILTRP